MEVPIGTIMAFAGPIFIPNEENDNIEKSLLEIGIKNAENLASTGRIPCAGYLIEKTDPQFKELYNVLMYVWGETSTKFMIPDLRGLFLRGVSNTSGRDPDADKRTKIWSGGATGNMVGSFQECMIQKHEHEGLGKKDFGDAKYNRNGLTSVLGGPADSAIGITATGGNETRPVNAYVNYIIKASNSPIKLQQIVQENKKEKQK